MHYHDFELEISRNGTENDYLAKVRSAQGEAQQLFALPDGVLLDNLILKMRGFSRSLRSANSPEVLAASQFGELLFSRALGGEISNLLKSCLDQTSTEVGLRIKLILQEAPELSALPWEFLYHPKRRDFIAHSPATPIVRYLQQASAMKPLAVTLPLKLLVVIASPSDFPVLDTAKERRELETVLAALEQEGELNVTWLEHVTVAKLAETLEEQQFHLLHFIGHSYFDTKNSEGALVLENASGRSHYYDASRLKVLLHDHDTLRLVVLNSCEGAKQDEHDPFSSIAATLMLAGIPAVIAMQFEISDQAAISFAKVFYKWLVKGTPIDEAVGRARKHLFAVDGNNVEWGTPVLYLRAKNGELFSVEKQPEPDLPGFKNLEGLNETLAREELAQKRAARLKQWKKYLTWMAFAVGSAIVVYALFYGLSVTYENYQVHQSVIEKQAIEEKAKAEQQEKIRLKLVAEQEVKEKTIQAQAKKEADVAKAKVEAKEKADAALKAQQAADAQLALVKQQEAEKAKVEAEAALKAKQTVLAEQQKQQAEIWLNQGRENLAKQHFKTACNLFRQAAKAGNETAKEFLVSVNKCKN